MKKAMVLVPAVGTVLALLALMARREEPQAGPLRKGPARESAGSAAAAPSSSTPAASPVAVKKVTAEEQGRILHQAALDQRVRVMVRASMSGDRATADALRDSLLRNAYESRPVVRERLAKAQLPREKEILEDLLRQLP